MVKVVSAKIGVENQIGKIFLQALLSKKKLYNFFFKIVKLINS